MRRLLRLWWVGEYGGFFSLEVSDTCCSRPRGSTTTWRRISSSVRPSDLVA